MTGLRSLGLSTLVVLATTSVAGNNNDEGYKNVNGTKLYYEVVGEGTPLVVVHGGPGLDHGYLLPQMAKLGNEFRLIFYDQRATGKSAVDVDSSSMTMENFVEDLEGIRRAFNLGKMNLMGHSWGGLVAMFYAVRFPNNLASLILVNPTPASAALRDSSLKIMRARTNRDDSLEEARITSTDAFKRGNPAALEKFFRVLFRGEFFQKDYADSLSLPFDSSYAEKSRMVGYLRKDTTLQHYDLFGKLDTISCPVLIIGGDADILPSAFNDRLQDHLRNARYILLPDCGHFPFVEAQGEFFPTIRAFLENIAP